MRVYILKRKINGLWINIRATLNYQEALNAIEYAPDDVIIGMDELDLTE